MYSKVLSSAAVALAASSLVSAQTFTDCDPLKKTCDPDKAIGKNAIDCDMTSGECSAFKPLPGTTIDYDDKGALFSIKKEGNAPTIATPERIFFGSLEVELYAAAGQGIVTSVVLESKDLDEIDWEFIGGDNTQVQSNYYGKGDTTTYDRVEYHPVDNPLGSFHTYKVDWTAEKIDWSIDGAVVRTLKYSDAQDGSRFPQTPMEVKIGTWSGGQSNSAPGTVEWAGGKTDFSKAPFNAWYKSVKVVDYAGKSSPTKEDIKEYVWTDKTGSWESIKVVKGDGSSDDSGSDKTSTTKKAEHSKTKTAEPTKTKESKSEKPTSTKEHTKKSSTTKEAKTTTTTPASSTMESSTMATPTSSGSGSDSGSQTSGSGSSPSQNPDNAANGILASFGRVFAAGAAAVVVAQLF